MRQHSRFKLSIDHLRSLIALIYVDLVAFWLFSLFFFFFLFRLLDTYTTKRSHFRALVCLRGENWKKWMALRATER